MTRPSAEPAAPVDWRPVVVGVLLGVTGTVLAIVFKVRCGIVPDPVEAFRDLCYSDVPAIWTAARLDQGAVPYLDHALEYPPLTGLWVWLAAFNSTNTGQFVVRTAGLLVVSGGAIGGMLGHMVGPRRTLVFAAAPTLLVAGAINWDLPSTALALAGLLAHRRGRDGWAGVWLGLGTAAKLWPALLIPVVALAALAIRGRRNGLIALAGAGGAWLVTNLPVAIVALEGWLRFPQLSRQRPPLASSLWALVPEVFGAGPDVATINLLSGLLVLTAVLLVLTHAIRHDPPQQWHLAALPLVASFLLASKVYSPQFTLWLLPLLALAMPPVWLLVAFLAADLAVHLTEFPYTGGAIGLTQPEPVWPLHMAVAVRAVLLTAVAWIGWRRSVEQSSVQLEATTT